MGRITNFAAAAVHLLRARGAAARAVLTAATIAACAPSSAQASDATGYWAFEKITCADFVTAYDAERKAGGPSEARIYTAPFARPYFFLAGWLSGINFAAPDTYNILPAGVSAAALWLHNYCEKNPLKFANEGLAALVDEAYPNRQKTAQK